MRLLRQVERPISLAAAFGLLIFLFSVGMPAYAQVPVISPNGVVNAADFTTAISPGALFSVWGSNLATRTISADTVPLPTTLAGTTVEIIEGAHTIAAPLFFVSGQQINAQMPFELTGSNIQVRVRAAAGTSAAVGLTLVASAPRFFTKTMDGLGEPILLHLDYTLVSQEKPAQPNEILVGFLTGLGAVAPSATSGQRANDGSPDHPVQRALGGMDIRVGGQSTKLHFAGLAPGWVGLYQVNLQLPAELLPGNHLIQIASGTEVSPQNVTFAVSGGWSALGSTTLGASGGTISQGGLRVVIPSGSGISAGTVAVYRSQQPDETALPRYRTSDVYALTGMPEVLEQPLTISLDLNAAVSGDPYVVVRTPGRGGMGSMFLAATIDGGRVTATIPATQGAAPTALGASRPAEKADDLAAAAQTDVKSSWSVWSIAGYHAMESPSGRFRITYPVTDLIVGSAEQIARSLDEAYTFLKDQVGLDWGKRNGVGSWPMEISMEPFTGNRAQRWGEEGSRLTGVQRQGVNLNSTFAEIPANLEYMKITAAHELFHVLQNLYDPNGDPSPWLWTEEAASTWLERRLAKIPSYIPPTVAPNPVNPVLSSNNYDFLTRHGLEFAAVGTWIGSGNAGEVQEHGYGASLFLEHLSSRLGNRGVGDILKQMEARATGFTSRSAYSPVEGIHRVTDVSAAWRLFCESYMDGQVYGGSPRFPRPETEILGMRAAAHVFQSATDPGPIFRWDNAPDLSAQVYLVNIQNPSWKNGTKIRITLTDAGGEAEAIIYQYRLVSGQMEWTKLAITKAEYTIGDAAALAASNQNLAIMVANGHAVKPFQGTTSIQLSVLTEAALPQPPYVEVRLMNPLLFTEVADNIPEFGFSSTASKKDCELKWAGSSWSSNCSWHAASPAKDAASCTTKGSIDATRLVLVSLEVNCSTTMSNGSSYSTTATVTDLPGGIVSTDSIRFLLSGNSAAIRRYLTFTSGSTDLIHADNGYPFSLEVNLVPRIN